MQSSKKKTRQLQSSIRDMLGGYVGCIGAFAMLLGIVPTVAAGGIGKMLLVSVALFGLMAMILMMKSGKNPISALMLVLLVGGGTFALMYGVMWYFMVYLMNDPNLIMPFSGPTATPK
jgi:hypothetical protein